MNGSGPFLLRENRWRIFSLTVVVLLMSFCVLLSHELFSTKYTTHQFTFYFLIQDNLKIAKIVKIQQVHQKIHPKQFLLFDLN